MLGREGKERGEQLTFLAEPQPHRLSGGEGGCSRIKTTREVGLSSGLPDGKLILLPLKVSYREVCEKNI